MSQLDRFKRSSWQVPLRIFLSFLDLPRWTRERDRRQLGFSFRLEFALGGCWWSLDFRAFAADIRSVNSRQSIVLIGMLGAGKSSVGRCLERQTGLARFDTDELV